MLRMRENARNSHHVHEKASRLLEFVAAGASCFLQIYGWVNLLTRSSAAAPGTRWLSLVVVFGAGCFVLTIVTACIPRKVARLVLLSVHAFLLSMLLLPFGGLLSIKLPFLLSLYLEVGIFLTLRLMIPIALFATLIIFGLQTLISGWDSSLVREKPLDNAVIMLLCAHVTGIGSLVQFFVARYERVVLTVGNLRESVQRLTDANTGFQQYLRVAEANSKTDERNRIIRELHDSIGFTLTTIIMLSESGLEQASNGGEGKLRELFGSIRENAKQGLTDVRVALRLMKARKETGSDLHALFMLVRAFEKATSVRVNCHFGNAPFQFGEGVDRMVFRIIQEGMVNAFRHGNATEISISLWSEEERFLIAISDNGRGSQDVLEGIGIAGIRERLQAYSGSLDYRSTPYGFTLNAVVPRRLGEEGHQGTGGADEPQGAEPS